MRLVLLPYLILAVVLFSSCSKDEAPAVSIPVTFQIEHFVDGASLALDSLKYENAAGNLLSISRLSYYLSDFQLIDEADVIWSFPQPYLVDHAHPEDRMIEVGRVPPGQYHLRFLVGLSPSLNQPGSLPNNLRNNEMIWPTMMGGGFHFIKLEGHFLNAEDKPTGFTVHLGTEGFTSPQRPEEVVKIGMDHPVITLRMEVLEWFDTPTLYDLNEGNYSMGDSVLMRQLSNNGRDAFTVLP
ncbi:MAG: hypothetical protein HQ500_03435 [Flavobacteriales bacterium]|nr:hypothetical protein [Flavobacteriales bacterium]